MDHKYFSNFCVVYFFTCDQRTKYKRYLINGRKKETVHSPQRGIDHVIRTEARGDGEWYLEEQDGKDGRSSAPFVGNPTEHDVAEETAHIEKSRRRGRQPAVVTYQI